jgi:hypothetical protein
MKKVELFVTEKGAKIKSNRWKNGDVVKVSEGIAKQLIEKGFCTDSEKAPKAEKIEKAPKAEKEK